jgi:septum formation protein
VAESRVEFAARDRTGVSVDPSLVLASASPRRRTLLAVLTRDFSIQPAALDESLLSGEAPGDYVARLAREKAEAIAAKRNGQFVLGADTSVVLDGRCLGKPGDPGEARRMLLELSGRRHEVYSAVALVDRDGGLRSALSVTSVRFVALPLRWVDRYVESGEPMDKAGAYAVQGQAAGWIKDLRGSYSGVVGLPLYETGTLLRDAQLI